MVIESEKKEYSFLERCGNDEIKCLFDNFLLPIIGVHNQKIVYTNTRLREICTSSFGVPLPKLKDLDGSIIRVNNKRFLARKIISNHIEYYLITEEKPLSNVPFPHVAMNFDGKVIGYNDLFDQILCDNKVATQKAFNLFDIIDEHSNEEFKGTLRRIKAKEIETTEIRMLAGELIYLVIIECDDKKQYHCYFINVTQYKKLEMEFLQSHKMQAIGQLAAGVVHDFNNLLTAILGFCDLLLLKHSVGDPSFADIMQIKQSSTRAANLTKQLLGMSRKQMLTSKVIDVTEAMSGITSLIRRLVNENIELKINCKKNLNQIKIDQGQFEQVLINLAINARDAILDANRENGALSIVLKNSVIKTPKDLGKNFICPIPNGQILPGKYILIEVIDNGTGISKKIMNNIFEPFFSTKTLKAGTGLGLSMVYGIVKQAEGHLYVDSQEGIGTKFHIYFKVTKEARSIKAEMHEEIENKLIKKDLTESATVLFVEDECSVRTFGACALSNKGYEVLEAENGEEALKIMQSRGKEIDLIVTDTVMPGISGPSLIMEVRKSYPRIKVLFISGYTEENFSCPIKMGKQINFLSKPFTLNLLTTKVKEILEKN
jgi:two-component system, cell cycle sensor histidine kinase and response regulator CckA